MGRRNAFKLDVVSVRLVQDVPVFSDRAVDSPEAAIRLVQKELLDMDREVVCVISLKADNTPACCNFASIGAVDYAMAHPRELLKSLVLSNAARMILVHNHPGGSLVPSAQDTAMTDRMMRLGELIGIPLLDHVIVAHGKTGFFSFREKRVLHAPEMNYAMDYRQMEWKEPAVAEKGRCR